MLLRNILGGGLHTMDMIGCAVVCNNLELLRRNLLASPDIRELNLPIVVEAGAANAGLGLNSAIERSDAGVVVCAHQDVYLPRGWFARLDRVLTTLEGLGKRWGVLGVVGVTSEGRIVGTAYSVGLGREVGERLRASFQPVVSLDEVVLIVNRNVSVRFDPELPSFHLYGTDIVQQVLATGGHAFAIDNPVIHNSIPVRVLDQGYRRAYWYMRHKWRGQLPIPTTVVPITRFGADLLWRNLCTRFKRVRANTRGSERHPEPALLAYSLGYDWSSS